MLKTTDRPQRHGQQESAAEGAGHSVVNTLRRELLHGAWEHEVEAAVIGRRYCAVRLDDGSAGVAKIEAPAANAVSAGISEHLPFPGTRAADVLALLEEPSGRPFGLATANALANAPRYLEDVWHWAVEKGDVLDVMDLRREDQVLMVGEFGPLVEPIRRRVNSLDVLERGHHLPPGLLPSELAPLALIMCSVALITSNAIVNGTVDALLGAARGCREVLLLGPSTPMVPAIFSDHPAVTMLSGITVTDSDGLLDIVAAGGGTQEFQPFVEMINLRALDRGEA